MRMDGKRDDMARRKKRVGKGREGEDGNGREMNRGEETRGRWGGGGGLGRGAGWISREERRGGTRVG